LSVLVVFFELCVRGVWGGGVGGGGWVW